MNRPAGYCAALITVPARVDDAYLIVRQHDGIRLTAHAALPPYTYRVREVRA